MHRFCTLAYRTRNQNWPLFHHVGNKTYAGCPAVQVTSPRPGRCHAGRPHRALPETRDRHPREGSQQPPLAETMERPTLHRQVPLCGFEAGFSSERLTFNLSGLYRQGEASSGAVFEQASGSGETWSMAPVRPAGLHLFSLRLHGRGYHHARVAVPGTGHRVTATRGAGLTALGGSVLQKTQKLGPRLRSC